MYDDDWSRLSKSRVFFLDYGGTLVKDTPTAPPGVSGVSGKAGYDSATRRRSKVRVRVSNERIYESTEGGNQMHDERWLYVRVYESKSSQSLCYDTAITCNMNTCVQDLRCPFSRPLYSIKP